MHLIICIDEKDGLSFCGRRLSRDSVLNNHILVLTAGHNLRMSPYSAPLFPEGAVCAEPDFLQKAAQGDYCFLEVSALPKTNKQLESVILYHWNRTYPSTVKFPRALLEGMQLTYTEEFSGNSHEKITMERYTYEA